MCLSLRRGLIYDLLNKIHFNLWLRLHNSLGQVYLSLTAHHFTKILLQFKIFDLLLQVLILHQLIEEVLLLEHVAKNLIIHYNYCVYL